MIGTTSAHAENTRNPSRIKEGRRTTSAHAENTFSSTLAWYSCRNYLRARGEYFVGGFDLFEQQELPPRTRRIPLVFGFAYFEQGTTSAHAENTRRVSARPPHYWNYLRARGEYCEGQSRHAVHPELPPRTRRILFSPIHTSIALGTTSAHAENTLL